MWNVCYDTHIESLWLRLEWVYNFQVCDLFRFKVESLDFLDQNDSSKTTMIGS